MLQVWKIQVSTYRPISASSGVICSFFRCGDHFGPHLDGPWVPNEEESSIFTVVIYLNSDFKGGATSFLSEGGGLHNDVS